MAFWDKLFGKGKDKSLDKQEKINNQHEPSPIIQNYISGLKNTYIQKNGTEEWEYFEDVIHGAKKGSLEKILTVYPETPDALLDLLKYVDGTYWREYKGEKITFYLLGSDVEEYPYYLLSSEEIVKNRNQAKEYFADDIDRKFEGVEIDERITNNSGSMNWLHFSDCMNNGGTSSLYIDFSPSKKGTKGQIVRYLHDPDELKVIADSFEEYLSLLMKNGYDFIFDDMFE